MKNQLNPLAAGLTAGIFWGLSMLLGTWIAMKTGVGQNFLDLFTDVYPNYNLTMSGAVWGLLWGFIDAFLGAYVLVWLYNFIAKKLGK
jgi:uncharacterized membrane protein YeaQ/YmgE (transglycosylase-associated protein family)